ncbi:MAG TPA: hypothetical protein VH639_17700 [Bryobacteraceae bacterium]
MKAERRRFATGRLMNFGACAAAHRCGVIRLGEAANTGDLTIEAWVKPTDFVNYDLRFPNAISTGEKYNFTYAENQTVVSPFDGLYPRVTALLSRATVSSIGTYHQFTYDSSAEMTNVQLSYKGALGYTYFTRAYSSGTSYREIASRGGSRPVLSGLEAN